MARWQIKCEHCKRICGKESEDQTMCFPCQEHQKIRLAGLKKDVPGVRKRCKGCGKEFNSLAYNNKGGMLYCSPICRESLFNKPNIKSDEVKAKSANKNWMEGKKRGRGRAVSYDELIRRSEYKRVFSDSGWSRFNKGKGWDKI